MKTIVGDIRYDAMGERANPRVLTVQLRGIKDKDTDQFRSPARQVILHPASDKTGNLIAPYDKARKA
jgi:branched-chain amino acid transport system substrate-binding protein